MIILIDIGHPAHVHYFKNFIKIMRQKGHQILVTARNRECTLALLRTEEIPYISRGKGANTVLGKILYTLVADLIILYQSLKHRPNIYLSHSSHYAMHIARILRKPCIATGDSDHIRINAKLLMPYISCLLTPSNYKLNYGSKHLRFDAYMELLYLHPNYFREIRNDIRKELGVKDSEKYYFLRFVSWNAFHDNNQKGISNSTKVSIVKLLLQHGRVIISSEKGLPDELSNYAATFHPSRIHNVLAGAEICISEGATTASESASLGTPTIYVNSLEVSYLKEQEERYSLCYNFRTEDGVLGKINELLANPDIKKIHLKNRQMMLKDKIDPTALLLWFIENYPESKLLFRNNQRLQDQFRCNSII